MIQRVEKPWSFLIRSLKRDPLFILERALLGNILVRTDVL